MAGGPAGPEVGRVTVRVAPDTSRFDNDLKRQLSKKRTDQLANDNRVPIRFKIDADDLKSTLDKIRLVKMTIPVTVDRKQAREAINKALEKPLLLKRVVIPVRVDRKQAREALRDAIADLNLTAGDALSLGVNEGNLKRSIKETLENAKAIAPELKFDEADLRRAAEQVRETVEDAVSSGKPVEVPVAVDEKRLDRTVTEARQSAAKALERDALRVSIEADATVLRREIAKAEADLDRLHTRGREIVIAANAAPVEREIAKVQARLDALHAKKVTPEIAVKIRDGERELERLRRDLEEINNRDYTADVDVLTERAEQKLARLNAQLARLEARRTRIQVEIDTDRLRVQADRDGDVVGRSLGGGIVRGVGKAFSGLATGIGGLFSGFPESIGKAFSSAASAVNSVADAMDGAAAKAKSAGGIVTQVLAAVLQAGLAVHLIFLQIGGAATLIAVAGAAVSAAWGAVSTAIAGIPALLALIGTPLAAIALGMDGIKKAAETLKPEFENLKKAVSDTFEKGLTPAFQTLKSLFPTIQSGLVGIAQQLSAAAQSMAKFLTEARQVELVKTLFENVKSAIAQAEPGIKVITAAILKLAGNKAALDALANSVNAIGVALNSIAENPALDSAFKGLSDVVAALTRAFAGLVNNGIKLFAAAAPGVTKFLDDLTGFFSKFDWDRLGKAVGNVFAGLGDILKDVDQSTIDAIVAAFERLGALFQDPAFQARIRKFIDELPGMIDGITFFVDSFSHAVDNLAGIVGTLGEWLGKAREEILAFFDVGFGVNIAWPQFWQSMLGPVGLFLSDLNVNLEAIRGAMLGFFGTLISDTEGQGSAWRAAFLGVFSAIDLSAAWETIKSSVSTFFSSLPGIISGYRGILWEAIASLFTGSGGEVEAGLQPVEDSITSKIGGWPAVIGGFAGPIGVAIAGLFKNVDIGAALDAVKAKVTEWGDWIKEKIKAAIDGVVELISGLAQKIRDGLSKAFAVGEAVGDLLKGGAAVAGGFFKAIFGKDVQAATSEITEGIAQVRTAAEEGIKGLSESMQTAFATALNGAVLAVQAAMTQMLVVVVAGMTAITVAVQTGLLALQVSFAALQATLVLVQTSMVALVATIAIVTAGLTVLAATIVALTAAMVVLTVTTTTWATSLLLLNVALLALGVSLTVLVPLLTVVGIALTALSIVVTALVPLLTALNLSLTAINITLGAMGVALAAINTGLTTINTTFTTLTQSIANFALALGNLATTAIPALVTAFTTGFQQIVEVVTTSGQQIVQAWTESMTALVDATTQGMDELQNVIRSALDAAVAILESYVSKFFQAGANMGQALADGLNSKVGAVEAAANRLAAAAAKATEAAARIASPSKVFIKLGQQMGAGLAIGIANEVNAVERAIKELVEAALDGTVGLDELGPNIAGRIKNAITGISGRIMDDVTASSVESQSGSQGSAPVVGTMIVQTPQGASASEMMDTALFRMRHVRRGVYSGY